MSASELTEHDPQHGLSSDEARQRLAEYGLNRLPEPPLPGAATIFLRQFLSPFIYILLVAAIASFVLKQVPNGIFIVVVLLLNAVIGTIQEHSAQRSAAALRNLVRGKSKVIRDGRTIQIDSEEVVPGDLALLASGDRVPADLQLISARELGADESMLTGESVTVEKDADGPTDSKLPLSDRTGVCYAGTVITRGRACGLTLSTGEETELGSIAHQMAGQREADPPLMIRVRRFTYQTAAAIGVTIVLLVAMMMWHGGYDTQAMALMAIGLAVSAIPEGLPAALTVALSIGMRRMAHHDVIIRKLVAVEALGSCTFICSDKTGTLTVNELTIRKVLLPGDVSVAVSGEGVAPGALHGHDGVPGVNELCTTGVLANESHLDYAGGDWVSDGDIVDVAFLVLAKKLGLSLSQLRGDQLQVELIPYESEKAFSGSFNSHANAIALHVKGSPEKILSMCDRMMIGGEIKPIDRAALEAQFEHEAGLGFRIIALAKREVVDNTDHGQLRDLIFLGMVAMLDPVRPEARDAVARCRRGGIEVAMITGDHPSTAKSIALDLELCGKDDPVITGTMIRDASELGQAEADKLIRPARVFARIEPQQKQQIVESLMRAGHFVAVTGDGVNDAPAMRQSHAGVAMGKRGTDVAKENAQLIITDDNFASIVDGIEQGRIVYNNIRKVIALLVATGFSALLLFFLTAASGLPMPMIAVQLLWLNLVANGLQDVALAFEPAEGGELDRAPRKPSEPIFERHIIEHVLVIGGVMGVLSFAVYYWLVQTGTDIDSARNLTLLLMVLFGNIHALSARSEHRSIFKIRFFANPFLVLAVPIAQCVHIAALYTPGLSDVLGLQPVSWEQWGAMAGVALLLLGAEELHKWILRLRIARGKKPERSAASHVSGEA